MKITLLTNKDLASCIALNRLVTALTDHELTVFLSAQVGNTRPLPDGLLQLKFFEQSLFNELIFPLLPPSPGTVMPDLLSFDGIAKMISKPIRELNAINQLAESAEFKNSEPDLVLCIRYGVILQQAVISIPRFGVLNLHSGKLPDYKGVMATFRAMLNGDAEIGTTVHYIDDSGIDTGPIIGTTSMPVDSARSYLWHVLELYKDGCRLLVDAVKAIADSGSVPARPQTRSGSYYGFPTEEELTIFAEMGYSLVDPAEIASIAKKFMAK